MSGKSRFLAHVLWACALVAVAFLISARMGFADRTRARVVGVPALNVREGPGTEYKASSWVAEGEQVEVEATVGSWARIRTRVGDAGWVNTNYLDYGGSPTVRPEPPTESPTPAPQAVETPSDPDAVHVRNLELTAEVARLRQELAALKEPPGATGTDASLGALRADVQRLLEQTEQIRRELAARPSGADRPRLPLEPDPSSPWILFGGGMLLGLFFGTAYGRRQERRRRTRIRI